MQAAELSIKELKDIKSEVNNFIELEFNTLEELDRNNLRFVLKRVVFLKYLIRQSGDFRFQALTSDIIYLISSIKKGEARYYYFNLRSIIEQALRIVNNIDSTNTITNTSLMEMTKELVSTSQETINLDVIQDEYNTSCLYVHGNENADMNLAEYYQNCIDNNEQIQHLPRKLRVLVKLLNELIDLIIISQNAIVDAAYHRRKSILKFLIGNLSYSRFERFRID
ncbi:MULTISPECIES: hypothetical protein [Bacillus cereus group]|uniref:hypothetical protein n=1 Tax=Bacillus cereus group TaxID=86661 RepID=UPI0021D0F485|nr:MULTISPECIES: hypothetical protein [Bacillus cereus group]MCU5471921.1 hypothetical protein [Bacillus paranthracis]MDA1514658.1 hypothetical protein [Bacillus cereus group sp. TH40LC]MDA1788420.1 hypothetical protein [Bacillus cereus group sp. BY5-1LC]MED0825976.1 hypothetical protein [Bacillus pacificus]